VFLLFVVCDRRPLFVLGSPCLSLNLGTGQSRPLSSGHAPSAIAVFSTVSRHITCIICKIRSPTSATVDLCTNIAACSRYAELQVSRLWCPSSSRSSFACTRDRGPLPRHLHIACSLPQPRITLGIHHLQTPYSHWSCKFSVHGGEWQSDTCLIREVL
jgi:hypothetical protein